MIAPPWNIPKPFNYQTGFGVATQVNDPSFQAGIKDGQNPFVPPAIPPYTPPISDRVYVIAPASSIPTIDAAVTQAQKDNARSPAFLYARGATFPSNGKAFRVWFNAMTIDATPGAGPQPIINATDTFLNFLSVPNVCVRNLNINCMVPGKEAGIRLSACPNAIIAANTVNGFIWGAEFIDQGNANAKVIGNTFAEQQPPPGRHGAGLYTQGTKGLVVAGNLFRHCAWLADPSNIGVQNQSHGWYGNESGSSDDVLCIGNVFIDCGGSAIGCRNGGEFGWNLIRGGSDASIIPQSQTEVAVNVHDNAIFGPVPDAPPNYGGGINVLAQDARLTNNYFASNAATPPNPAVSVVPGPLPPSAVAIDGLKGWWGKPPLFVQGRTVTQANVNTKLATPATATPRLTDYLGCSEADLYARIRAEDGPFVVDWLRRSAQLAGM